MGSTSINHLPVELQISILKHLLLSLRQPPSPRHVRGDPELWTERDHCSPSLFPYNVASACMLWRDILVSIPECWTRVVFDVAKDPAPFIDVFLWSKGMKHIEVAVFNSSGATEVEDADRKLENRRVSTIYQALKPHIYRCKSIVFNIVYSTSLPPPTPFLDRARCLEELSLNCRIDDIVVGKDSWTTNGDKGLPPMATWFPTLSKLSLTGFWFMYLALNPLASDWFRKLKLVAGASLCISKFKFLEGGHYSLPSFLSYLTGTRAFDCFHFCDLSLSYDYSGSATEVEPKYKISGNIHFESVSYDFLAHIYAIANISTGQSFLTFEACRIPPIRKLHFGRYMLLTNIIDDDQAHSLRHALEMWAGGYLEINSCPSFNDAFISWLGMEVDHRPLCLGIDRDQASFGDNFLLDSHKLFRNPFMAFPAQRLVGLLIQNCSNFRPQSMCAFLQARNDAALAAEKPSAKSMIEELLVQGRVPVLSKEDKDWFAENAKHTVVNWRVEDDAGIREDFSSNGKMLLC